MDTKTYRPGLHDWLQAFALVAREEILKHYRPDSCIASTAIGLAALKALGIPAVEIGVEAKVFNRVFVEFVRMHGYEDNSSDWTERMRAAGGHVVIVGSGQADNDDGTRFSGPHVVMLVADRYLVDLSLDQASRPAKKLNLMPLVIDVPFDYTVGRFVEATGHDGVLVIYERKALAGHDLTPNWTNPANYLYAGQILGRMSDLMPWPAQASYNPAALPRPVIIRREDIIDF